MDNFGAKVDNLYVFYRVNQTKSGSFRASWNSCACHVDADSNMVRLDEGSGRPYAQKYRGFTCKSHML